jgi:hypothetical protein
MLSGMSKEVGRLRTGVRRAAVRDFSSLYSIWTDSVVHRVSYAMRTCCSFSEVVKRPGRFADYSPSYSVEVTVTKYVKLFINPHIF